MDFRDAYQAYNFTDATGATQTYSAFSAAAYMIGCNNITIENCAMDNSGLGLFILSNNGQAWQATNILVKGNYLYNNGVPGSYLEHNSYAEADGITYLDNYFGSLRPGATGSDLKDRSAGTVIADNYFQPAANMLDLVDPEDAQYFSTLPSFANTYVYGNVFNNTGPNATAQIAEFGGDSGTTSIYRPNLEFYDNTVINVQNQSTNYSTDMFNLDTSAQTVYAANNIFYNAPATSGATPSNFDFARDVGNITFSPTNWVSPGWFADHYTEPGQTGSYSGTITGTSTFFVDPNNNPKFLDTNGGDILGGDYHLQSGSNAIGIAGTLNSSWATITSEYAPFTSSVSRTSVADAGAYEAGTADPTLTNTTPAPTTMGVAVGTALTATFNEAVQSGTIAFTLATASGSSVAGTVNYNPSTDTATFTPSAPLASGTTYVATVNGAEDGTDDLMSGPESWSFTTTGSTAPSVTGESPAANATAVPVSSTVIATFNEAVQSGTITFTLTTSAGSSVTGALSYNSTTFAATFTPSAALAYGTTYTATVSGAQGASGPPMPAPFSWSFTTDPLQPAVSSHTPATGATGVAVSVVPSATFNEAVQSGTVTFTLTTSAGTSVAGTASYNAATNTETFTPSAALASGTTYTATVSGAKDVAGDPMSGSTTWTFTTTAGPAVTGETPASGATQVQTNSVITATFSTAMLLSTITGSNFVLKSSSGTTVAANVSYNSTTFTATLTPFALLSNSTTYTATVSGVTDLLGNLLGSPFSWSFSTGPAPSVSSHTPASGATGTCPCRPPPPQRSTKPCNSSTIAFTLANSARDRDRGGSYIQHHDQHCDIHSKFTACLRNDLHGHRQRRQRHCR